MRLSNDITIERVILIPYTERHKSTVIPATPHLMRGLSDKPE
jgi:hypothetical protein